MSSKDTSNPPPSSEQPPEKKQKLESDNSNDGDMVAVKPSDHTNYEFVELEKAKGQPFSTDIVFNVSMVGRIPEENTTKMFEARVQWCKLEYGRKIPFDVYFCREKASEGDNSNDGDSDEYINPLDYDESEDEGDRGSECSDRSRSMTSEEMEQYMAAVEASDGFDVLDFGDVLDCGRITPIHLEKANMQGCRGIVSYLTLVGGIPNVNTTKSFEARVLLGIPENAGDFPITVYFCREKASKGAFTFNSFFPATSLDFGWTCYIILIDLIFCDMC
ncbi:hypothetical protein PTKIN_Ptkin19aG0071000 [Pterospermum kingtungense]